MSLRILALLVGLFGATIGPNASAQPVTEFDVLARQCAPSVHPTTLAAVVKAESSFRAYAININGGAQLPRQPDTQPEAVSTAKYLLANGYNFDSGLGQINSKNVSKFSMSWEDVFEPCANLAAAARVLTDCFTRAAASESNDQAALRNALSCYNTGTFTRGHANGYVSRVERSAGKNPAALVPALLPDGQSIEESKTGAAGPQPMADEAGAADAFGRDRTDAFGRAAARSRMERTLRSEEGNASPVAETASKDHLPITLTGSTMAY